MGRRICASAAAIFACFAFSIVPRLWAAPPANDDCAGAIAIPPPSDATPIVMTAPVDITDATPQDVDEGILACAPVDRTIWYSFTPTVTGEYFISTCGSTATGSTVYDTALAVFASTGGACPASGSALACNDSAVCTEAVPGAPYVDQSTITLQLDASTTYFIVAGHWSQDMGGVAPGFNDLVVSVQSSPGPRNDSCTVSGGGYAAGGTGPAPLALDRITLGTTLNAANDYRSTTCPFPGPGQIPTTSNGIDVVFSFEAPSTDLYSFRYVQDDSGANLRFQGPSLYLSTQCPAPDPVNTVAGCFVAANRMNDQTTGNGNRSEEINCVALTGGTTYYLFFDDRFAGNVGGELAVEVTRCKLETEPNDSPQTATPFAPNSGCWMEGGAIAAGPAADIDFYDLGQPPAGSKIFAAVDSAAATTSDFELRITDSANTLGYDDDDGSSWIGSNAPIVAGPIANGNEIYARVNSKTVSSGNQPYQLHAKIESGPAFSEAPEQQPGGPVIYYDRFLQATHLDGSTGYVDGIMSTIDDEDCFQFTANEGDNIDLWSDNNPGRAPGTITNVWPVIELLNSYAAPSDVRFLGQVVRNLGMPGPGAGLTAVTPSATSEFSHYRARYTGVYVICYRTTQDSAQANNPPAAAYPLRWAGDIVVNCGPPAGPESADVSINKTGPAGPVQTGSIVEYTITITNNSTTAIAQDVELVDTLPAGLNFAGLTVTDYQFASFNRNTFAVSLPTPGENDAPIDVVSVSMAPGAVIKYVLSVQVASCIGSGVTIENAAHVSSYTLDSNPSNDSASWSFTTFDDGTCTPLACDPTGGCIIDICQVNGICTGVGGTCQTELRDCDDQDVCTADSCDPTNSAGPCVHDSSQLGDCCGDGNDCTVDYCDPIQFCVFPPAPRGTPCFDFPNCPGNECNGMGQCTLAACDDGLPCTDDFVDDMNNCTCGNATGFPGMPCDDGNACTIDTTCDGIGGTADHCTGGTAVSCDDTNPCTDDSCSPSSGCVHAPNSASCDDGNACTVGDTCGGGSCNPGAPLGCDDGNSCTDDTCDPASGCVHTNNTAPCGVQGNACVTAGTCGGGECHAGAPVNCDDGDCCTIDGCDPAAGCTHVPNPAGPAFTTQPSLGTCPVLWPPEHGYADFTVAQTAAAAQSACGVTSIQWASCASSQVENAVGTGDGNTTRDCVYSGATLSARAERDGACSPIGRTYTSRLIAVDACGHAALSDPVVIAVWHDRGHPPASANVYHAAAGSGTNDGRAGTNGSYPTAATCGAGSACANGSEGDDSDADPEAEIRQLAALSVDSLRLDKASGGLQLSWTAPVASGQVTRYHVWKLDPATLFWTQIAELARTSTSYADGIDGASWQYKVTAVIK